jgi:hypothetical protein
VLLHLFEKNTDKLPDRDRELAIQRFGDFKERMDAERRVPPRAVTRRGRLESGDLPELVS